MAPRPGAVSTLLLALVLPFPALASDYLSESTADSYRYVDAVSGRAISSRITRAAGGWNYWQNFAGLGDRWVYTYPNDEWFWIAVPGVGVELMPTLAAPVGFARTVNLGPANHGQVIVAQAGISVATPAGVFNDVVRLDLSPSAPSAGLLSIWFARGIGIVKWTELTTTGTVVFELATALVSGQSYPQPVSPNPPPPSAPQQTVEIYGESISAPGGTVVYVLDISASMGWGTVNYTDLNGYPRTGSRMEAVTTEVARSVQQLDPGMSLNVILYDCGQISWSPALRSADVTGKADAVQFVLNAAPTGATGTGPAVTAALADPSVYTVVLVTDGAPNCGASGMTGHADMIRKANVQGAQVHCFGIQASGSYAQFIQDVATQSGGRCVLIP